MPEPPDPAVPAGAPPPRRPLPPALAALAEHARRLSPVAAVAAALVAAAVLASVVVGAWRAGGGGPPVELTLPRAGGPGDPSAPAAGAASPPPGAGAEGGEVYVHVAGAVAHPGLYRLPAGARVAGALDAAGGPAPEADLDAVNLAARVADGERLWVPRPGEPPPPAAGPVAAGAGAAGAAAAGAGPVDLNRATAEQLDALPGIGPATAAAVVAHRHQHGPFRSVDELIAVRGIGPAKLAVLRPLVTV